MRTLSSTIQTMQKGRSGIAPLARIVLTYGASSYTYDFRRVATSNTRILKLSHPEKQWSQTATVVLNDSDLVLTGLDLEGYKGVISYGFTTSAGDEWSATAPLWVVGQQRDSMQGKVSCSLSLEGIFDRMAKDKASASYTQASDDTNTIKTLITAIAGATLAPYTHCKAFTVTYDSEDSLIDSFIPADLFRVTTNDTRLSKIQELIAYTGCVIRPESDGNLHVFEPVTSIASTGTIRPNAAGDECNLANQLGDACPDHYLNVDEAVTDDDTTYNEWASSDTPDVWQRDLYNLATISDDIPIASITVYARARNSFATVDQTSLKIAIKTGGTAYEGDEETMTNSYALYSKQWTTNPDTGIPWTKSDIDALQAGVSLRNHRAGLILNRARCTQLYVEVEYGYDYEYNLADTYHTFLSKRFRRRVVSPNYIVARTHPDDEPPAYTGFAKDASADLTDMEERQTKYVRATSNAQCTSIATALLSHYQLQDNKGMGILPIMNIGAEIYDYNKITDSRASDNAIGNVGWITRNIAQNKFGMAFGFGIMTVLPMLGIELAAGAEQGFVSFATLMEVLEIVYDDFDALDEYLKKLANESVWIDDSVPDDMDDLADGSTYAKVLVTDISAGHILLSETIKSASYRTTTDTEKGTWNGKPDDMDDIGEGVTYKRVLATNISSGRIVLTAANYYSGKFIGEWYNESGVVLDATVGLSMMDTDIFFYDNDATPQWVGFLGVDVNDNMQLFSRLSENLYLFASGDLYIGSTNLSLLPWSTTTDLGDASQYWDDVNYSDLIDRTPSPMEIPDALGKIKNFKTHMSKKTIKGVGEIQFEAWDRDSMPAELLRPVTQRDKDRAQKHYEEDLEKPLAHKWRIDKVKAKLLELNNKEGADPKSIEKLNRILAELEMEKLPEAVYNEPQMGISMNAQIGLIYSCLRELIEKVEALEAK